MLSVAKDLKMHLINLTNNTTLLISQNGYC